MIEERGMIVESNQTRAFVVNEITDPQEIARHRAQDERHLRNLDWLQMHWNELSGARGRYVAVANQQSFVADTADAAWDWARLQHPHDDGAVVMLVPAGQGWRIYANCR